MAAPANAFSFDFEVTKKAAQNWYERTSAREVNLKLLSEKRYDAVESRERLAKRANRLLERMRQTVPPDAEAFSADLLDMMRKGRVAEHEISNDLFERVIGATRDFLSVQFLEMGFQTTRCVGRIVTRLGGGRVSYGTGFLVSPRLILTNCHVLRTAAEAADSVVELDYQLDRLGNPLPVQKFELDPETFFLNDRDLDFALVAAKEKSARGRSIEGYGWSPLIKEEGKITQGDCVNIIQHPRGEMKQLVIRENRLVDLLETLAHYEGDTEPGSSGSPVFNDQWEVVALHHSAIPRMDKDGNFLDVDGKIWKSGDDQDRLAWVANEGIRVSRLVDFVARAKVREHEKRLRDDLLSAEQPPSGRATELEDRKRPLVFRGSGEARSKPVDNSASTSLSTGGVTVTLPLNITISLGSQAASAQAVVQVQPAAEPSLEKIEPDPDYTNRPGYDPDFLGFSTPLPKLMSSIQSDAVKVPGAAGPNKFELKYYNYSVIMNRRRRLAFVSAVNFDGSPTVKHKREGKDEWFFDPRIDEEFQAGDEFYASNPLDRGHLVRRADAAWGETKSDAKLANDDTFHFTNCSPQHEIYNQATKANKKGLLLWGNLEEHVAEQARTDNKRLCVFNGPVFRSNDRKHRGLQIPREYWKIVVFEKANGKAAALAFLLSQASLIKNLPDEEFEVGPYAPFQMRIRDIESKTRLDFGKLRDFDPLEHEENERFFESGMDAVPLERLEDIVL